LSSGRAAALGHLIAEAELDALIVEGAANLRYIAGYTGSNGLALVRADGGGRFLTDFRYAAQIAEELDDALEAEIVTGDLFDALAGALPGGRIGYDDTRISVRQHAKLSAQLAADGQLVATAGLPERLRAVKDESEIAVIARAAELIDGIYGWLAETGLAGRRERDVAIALEHEMRLRGASAPSFDSIVAAGAHGALPHAQPDERTIERGMLVTIDIGAIVDGYCSDCTRTFAVGEPSAQAREIYEVVHAAQLAGLEAIVAGVSGVDADAAARAVIEQAGYGERFGHGLGHGVGLEIHEAPRLSRTSTDAAMVTRNVVTVEPGVYLPGELGVRIEDLVVVRDEHPQVLSSFTKELLVLD
jgi:Xaa-Pro aminopeptidase